MDIKWISFSECPYCSNKDFISSGTGIHPTISKKEILGGVPLLILTTYRQCLGCGLIRQDPRMDDASLEYFYSSGLYRNMVNGDDNACDAYESRRYDGFVKILPTPDPGDKLLDVGCSHGYLLDLAEGYEVLGVEPNAAYVLSLWAKRHTFVYGTRFQVDLLKNGEVVGRQSKSFRGSDWFPLTLGFDSGDADTANVQIVAPNTGTWRITVGRKLCGGPSAPTRRSRAAIRSAVRRCGRWSACRVRSASSPRPTR